MHLANAIQCVQTNSSHKVALDFGCGSGNLTRHLVELGVYTIAADVSAKFLKLVEQKFAQTSMVKTLKLNGRDLANMPSESLDLVATYSVLHHIPDYLGIIKEFFRVLRKGGILYLDHEVNPNYWQKPPLYQEFLHKVQLQSPQPAPARNWQRFFKLSTYRRKIKNVRMQICLKLNPRYSIEGDIHVWENDHIEWDKIEHQLREQGCEIILQEDYLLYKRDYPRAIYEEYKDTCHDIRVLAARKK